MEEARHKLTKIQQARYDRQKYTAGGTTDDSDSEYRSYGYTSPLNQSNNSLDRTANSVSPTSPGHHQPSQNYVQHSTPQHYHHPAANNIQNHTSTATTTNHSAFRPNPAFTGNSVPRPITSNS